MKQFSLFALLSLAGLGVSAPTSNLKAARGYNSAPGASGTMFTIDGETKYFTGTNCYWCSYMTNDADHDTVFGHMSSSGLKILRIWGFNDVNTVPSPGTVYFQTISDGAAKINDGADGLQTLDKAVAAAEKYGIKLIINFVNNWGDYGGFQAYLTGFNAGNGTENPSAWYTSEPIQKAYQNYVQTLVNRYKDSNAIFAWELGNEPRCKGCDTSVITNWAATTSKFIKSLDSAHMVTLGDEGFGVEGGDGSYPYSKGDGVDFSKNLEIDTLDFGTYHLYPGGWGITDEAGNAWVQAHAAACKKANKPCLFEEYGATHKTDLCPVESKWQQTASTTDGNSADLFWQFGDNLAGGKSLSDDYSVFYGTDDYKCLVTGRPKSYN